MGQTVCLSPALNQPIAASDVALAVADAALAPPVNGMVDIAGPGRFPLAVLAQRWLQAVGDPRTVLADPAAPYFGLQLGDSLLTPGSTPRLGTVSFQAWLAAQ